MAPIKLGASTTAIQAVQGSDLTGKTAVVTGDDRPQLTLLTSFRCFQVSFDAGGNSGLGVETARALSYAGARVIITSRNLAAGQEVADELNGAGLKVHICNCHTRSRFAATNQ